jgi:hypothetical protein
MGRRYDCIFNLRLWLEYHCNINWEANEFIFAHSGLDEPIQIKERLHSQLIDDLRGDEFVIDRVLTVSGR